MKKTVQALTTGVVRWPDLAKRLEHFSDWHKVRRGAALCRQYIMYLAKRRDMIRDKEITVSKLLNAEKVIIKPVQKDLPGYDHFGLYPAKRSDANKRREAMKRDTNLYRLDPHVGTDGLVLAGGQI